ncbi:MAG: hypothetical protein J5I93_24810 [Pirellulaceae bacterium]|nr:hypothetical protein [Pirellulaceae bacterium]
MAKKKHNPGQQTFDSLDGVPAMPDGYYSGDQPNPNLRRFVEEHATPYDAESDKYNVRAFNQPITTTKATAIYNMHTYWSKKPYDAIQQYIRHFTDKGDLVLDPFCGSGGTALATLLEGRKAVAIDRSPAAVFITKNYATLVDSRALEAAFLQVLAKAKAELQWLYSTRCDRCNGEATVTKTVYSSVFQCPRCLHKIPLFDCVESEAQTAAGKAKRISVCPICMDKGHIEEISTRREQVGTVPVLVFYTCLNGCSPARDERRHNDTDPRKRRFFEKCDLAKIAEIENTRIPHWYPPHKMMNVEDDNQPWGDKWRAGTSNFRTVAALFTKRNLWALATWMDAIKSTKADPIVADMLRFMFTSNVFSGSRLQQYHEGGGGFQRGTYYIPQLSLERNQLECFERKAQDVVSGTQWVLDRVTDALLVCSTQSCTNMQAIPANSIDYIFTDPAYADSVQYGELNFVWEAWLGLDTNWHSQEIVVNAVRKKDEADWSRLMAAAMAECYRVLKPGRWVSLCYHDTSEGTWGLVQDIMAEAGFVVDKSDKTLFIETSEKSSNQRVADNVTKRDLVLNFRKPKPGEWKVTQIFIPANVDVPTFNELARQIVRDYLTRHPGATKDRIYDTVVSCMVRKGQMEAHDFEVLLKSVAEEVQQPVKEDLFRNKEPDLWGSHVQSRWYLKETADQVDQAEQAKEDAAATRLSKFMGEHLKKRPELEGVHYSDLFEQYLPVQDKPRRLLADWLPEYFIKTPSGTWRLPDKEEADQLAQLREQGTLRRIKRFANALIDGVPIRDKDRPGGDVDLLDWLRQCRRAGLYEQGRAIYEKGGLNLGNLSDEQQIEAEDDYRICVRRGSDEKPKPKRKSRKKQSDDE